jgi:cell division protein FtsZ
VQENANPDANIIFGATSSDDFEDQMRVTVIATGFEKKAEETKSASGAKVADVSDVDEIFNLFRR